MSLTNAYTVLFDSTDVETGTTANPFTIDGAGVAGTPAGGVVSVQGVAGGTALPISGTVTANQGTPAVIANAWYTQISNGVAAAAVQNTTPVGTEFGLVVRVAGPVTFTETRPATATVTSVTVAVASTTILASNANRLGAILWAQGGTTYIKMGTAASSASFTARLLTNSEWEIPQPNYTGIITGSASAGTNTILATELTP